jgi:eukaryotic-like serine/threonine-protein kinase
VSNPTQPEGIGATAPAGTEDMPPGTLVGEYKIESRLGQGGMGTVYAARHPVIGKRVAVKVLSYFFSRDAGLVKRFTDEARAVNKIGHPNIIDVFSFGRLADGRQYFVMEYLEGETMTAWLDRGAPPFAESRRFLLQICEALEAAHREGIVHRDLKPDNIWIARPKHGEPYTKVLDFGLAKLMDAEQEKSATRTGTIMGTPQFMSPEQCVGRGVDHRTDIYALGAIIFRIYSGRLAFDGSSSAEIIAAQLYQPPPKPSSFAAMAPKLEALILDCLEKDPNRRPASAIELSMRLREATQSAGAVTELMAPQNPVVSGAADTQKGFATNDPSFEKSSPPPTRKRSRTMWIALVLLLFVGVMGALWARIRQPTSSGGSAASKPAAQVAAPVPAAERASVPPTVAPPVLPEEKLADVKRPASAQADVPAASGSPERPTAGKPLPRVRESAPAPAETKSKTSRAAREGLIRENPFQ